MVRVEEGERMREEGVLVGKMIEERRRTTKTKKKERR